MIRICPICNGTYSKDSSNDEESYLLLCDHYSDSLLDYIDILQNELDIIKWKMRRKSKKQLKKYL